MGSKFLQIFTPLVPLIPEIKPPPHDLSHTEKFTWTFLSFCIYTIFSSLTPLVINVGEGDPFSFIRNIAASTHGSFTELGVLPILVTMLIMLILRKLNIITVDYDDPRDCKLYYCCFKVLCIVFTIILALVFLLGGTYGRNLNTVQHFTIIIQFILVGIVIIYLDELLSKGWGYGSGILLFILGITCFQIFDGLLSIQAFREGPGEGIISNRGIIVAFFAWAGNEGVFKAIEVLFFRFNPNPDYYLNLPKFSLFTLFFTFGFIFLLDYLALINIKLIRKERLQGGLRKTKRINLLSLLTLPILLTYTLFSLIYALAKVIWTTSGGEGTNNFFANILGTFALNTSLQQYVPNGGLVYFFTPPQALLEEIITNPLPTIFRILIYGAIFIGVTRYFFMLMIDVQDPLISEKIAIFPMFEDFNSTNASNAEYKEAYLKNLFQGFFSWGMLVASIIIVGEIFSVLGSGVGLFVSVSAIIQYTKLQSLRRKI